MQKRTAGGGDPRRATPWLALAFGVALAASGCGVVPQFGPAPRVGPPAELAGSAPPDTMHWTPTEPVPTPARRERPAGASNGHVTPTPASGNTVTDRVNERPNDPGSTAAPDSSRPARTLSIDLPEAERARLETQTLQDIEAARQLADEAKGRSLTAAEQEKLLTVMGLVGQAEHARESADLTAASNLARKARLLAAELVPK
ncbi:MAG: hypothetical protein U0527_08780 [Candidatus Eisenbacteria bacterium]